MSEQSEESRTLDHYRLDPIVGNDCYLLLCSQGPVTIRSQQVRAMNLVWALRDRLTKPNVRVAVIGGGAAGLTFAAGATKLGAFVELFEPDQLMHLQMGSWHRPLHPEIYSWPNDTAWRPVSHLPLLGWTTGTAHDVATQIVSKFLMLQESLHGRLLTRRSRATLNAEGDLKSEIEGLSGRRDIVVVAVGFGIESSVPGDLPFHSYWRADALDQSFLGTSKLRLAVIGGGDGGLIDVLRSCVPRTEQGPLLDHILAQTLQNDKLLEDIKAFSGQGFLEGKGLEVERRFRELELNHETTIKTIDTILLRDSRKAEVTWLIRGESPFDSGSQPMNRFLVSRLLAHSQEIGLKPIRRVDVERVWYEACTCHVLYRTNGASEPETLDCDHLSVRIGPRRQPKLEGSSERSKGLLESVRNVFDGASPDFLLALDNCLSGKQHEGCERVKWDDEFAKKLEIGKRPAPVLLAEFVRSFAMTRTGWRDNARMVYRIRIWLQRSSSNVSVSYDLHPEEQNKPITRVGIGQYHEQWINTSNDYKIRVRTSDGYEWPVGTVLQALSRRYALAPPHEDLMAKADTKAREPLMAMLGNQSITETAAEAMARILEQSTRFQDNPSEWLST